MLKETIVLGGLVLAGAYFSGALSGLATHTRTVERPQAAVMSALETLDIREAPGSPGTDPAASGGVKPVIQLEQDANEMRWKVMSGDKVATTMFADFKPTGDGKQTNVTLHVERGDAPDDFVSPAFRSKGITLGLFSLVVEDKLNNLVEAAVVPDAKSCEELQERFADNQGPQQDKNAHSLTEAFARTAAISMKFNAYAAERRRLGCDKLDQSAGGGFQPVHQEMAPAAP